MEKETYHKKENKDIKEEEKKMVTISEEEFLALKDKEKEIMDKMLRLQADVDNIKKRLERDKEAFIKFSNEQIIRELIPFVDDFKRAFEAADNTKDFNVLHKGVEMILKHLLELLKSKGVREIEAEGKPFDPAYHEAMLQVETDEYPEDTIIEELEKGYLLNSKVLRTAKVKVSKAKSDSGDDISEQESDNETDEEEINSVEE